MDQFRLFLGLGLVATQLGVSSLMLVLFLKTRGEHASRYWALASVGTMLSTLVSGFLPMGRPPVWVLYLSAILNIAGLWMVWRGFRSYRELPVPWWGWAVPGSLLLVFASLPLMDAPQIYRSVSFTLTSCTVLVLVTLEALATRDSKARWLVVLATVTNASSFIARPVLTLLGYDVSGRTDNPASLLATYLVPISDFFILYSGLALLAVHKVLIQKDALATLDELTQLPNRRAMVETARREVRASCRSGLPFALMLVDIDHFKDVNDSSGHAAGDVVLRELGRVLVSACRPTDFVSRYGGDEFVVLCPGLGLDQGRMLARRLADAVRSATVGGSAVTVSVGIAVFEACDEPASWEAVFDRADRALYAAKEAGRDRVVG